MGRKTRKKMVSFLQALQRNGVLRVGDARLSQLQLVASVYRRARHLRTQSVTVAGMGHSDAMVGFERAMLVACAGALGHASTPRSLHVAALVARGGCCLRLIDSTAIEGTGHTNNVGKGATVSLQPTGVAPPMVVSIVPMASLLDLAAKLALHASEMPPQEALTARSRLSAMATLLTTTGTAATSSSTATAVESPFFLLSISDELTMLDAAVESTALDRGTCDADAPLEAERLMLQLCRGLRRSGAVPRASHLTLCSQRKSHWAAAVREGYRVDASPVQLSSSTSLSSGAAARLTSGGYLKSNIPRPAIRR